MLDNKQFSENLETLKKTKEILYKYVNEGHLKKEDFSVYERMVDTIEKDIFDGNELDIISDKNEVMENCEIETEFENDYEYVIRDDGIVIKKYISFERSIIIIPDEYKGVPVIGIGAQAFYHIKMIKTVILGKNISFIGEAAFLGCKSLCVVQWNSTLRAIGSAAFGDTALEDIHIPNRVAYIGSSAFSGSKCRNVTLPSNLLAIEHGTFSGCKLLKTIIIPSCVRKIGSAAFSDCDFLSDVYLNEGIIKIDDHAFLNCTNLKTIDIPSSVLTFGEDIFAKSYIFQIDRRYNPKICYEKLDITIECKAGSEALKYARRNDFKAVQSNRLQAEEKILQRNEQIAVFSYCKKFSKSGFDQNSERRFETECKEICEQLAVIGIKGLCFLPYINRPEETYMLYGVMNILIFRKLKDTQLVRMKRLMSSRDYYIYNVTDGRRLV